MWKLIGSCAIGSLLLSGCASAIVGAVCASNKGPQDMSLRHFEVAATIATGGETQTLTKAYACQPKGYACYGGDWYPQFAPQGLAFHIDLPDGSMSLPTPMCESSYNAANNWTEIQAWPVAERIAAGDKYTYTPRELQHESAERVAGVRVVHYKIRRVAE